jgi:hypothetical protein
MIFAATLAYVVYSPRNVGGGLAMVEGDLTIMADRRALVERAAAELDLPPERLLTDMILNLLANDRCVGSALAGAAFGSALHTSSAPDAHHPL